jgi:hypothetical protein
MERPLRGRERAEKLVRSRQFPVDNGAVRTSSIGACRHILECRRDLIVPHGIGAYPGVVRQFRAGIIDTHNVKSLLAGRPGAARESR